MNVLCNRHRHTVFYEYVIQVPSIMKYYMQIYYTLCLVHYIYWHIISNIYQGFWLTTPYHTEIKCLDNINESIYLIY